MQIKEGQSYEHQKGTHCIQLSRWMKSRVKVRKTEDAYSATGEKDQPTD
jgi:hypothetical protein